MVADCHHGDDLAAIEEQSQRTLHDNRGLNLSAFVIDTSDGAGQPGIIRLRANGKFLHGLMMGRDRFRCKRPNAILRRS